MSVLDAPLAAADPEVAELIGRPMITVTGAGRPYTNAVHRRW
ncbi:hypothetical protein [Pseudonocardia sp.]